MDFFPNTTNAQAVYWYRDEDYDGKSRLRREDVTVAAWGSDGRAYVAARGEDRLVPAAEYTDPGKFSGLCDSRPKLTLPGQGYTLVHTDKDGQESRYPVMSFLLDNDDPESTEIVYVSSTEGIRRLHHVHIGGDYRLDHEAMTDPPGRVPLRAVTVVIACR